MLANDLGEGGAAFALPDLWKLSEFTVESEDPVTKPADQFGLAEINLKEFVPLPSINLESIEHIYSAIDVISAPESVVTSELESLQISDNEEDDSDVADIWTATAYEGPRTKHQNLRSWERFYDHDFTDPTKYLSEAGPKAFDAALSLDATNTAEGKIMPHVIIIPSFIRAVLLLGLGQESDIFCRSETANIFSFRVDGTSMTGVSKALTASVVKPFAGAGARIHALEAFVKHSYSLASSSIQVALAETISTILSALKRHIVQISANVRSLLQLQAAFRQPMVVLQVLTQLTDAVRVSQRGHGILSDLYLFTEGSEYRDACTRAFIQQILARVSNPWLDALSSALGLRSSCGDKDLKRDIIECAGQYDDGDAPYLTKTIPKFISGGAVQTALRTCHSLEELKEHFKTHALVAPEATHCLQAPSLQWRFSWEDLKETSYSAEKYEKIVINSIKEARAYNASPDQPNGSESNAHDCDINPYGTSDSQIKQQLSESLHQLERKPSSSMCSEDKPLFQSLQNVLSPDAQLEIQATFAPSIALASTLSFRPIISSQARLVNFACLQMLFQEHNLTSHLEIQRRFHLFGDGVFATRLSQALFDPNVKSAERRKGFSSAGKIGLRLESRSNWPPASSELRLVLMDILTEAYYGSSSDPYNTSGELPGNLSFGLRDLSEPEIERCLDRSGLEALDFLRLRYQPPAPLNLVLTPLSLEKYDQIFRFLLRIQRLLALTAEGAHTILFHLGRTSSRRSMHGNALVARMRFEMGHFVAAVADYFLGPAISGPWDHFFRRVQLLEASLEDVSSPDDERKASSVVSSRSTGAVDGLHTLRVWHNHMLDGILSALLLREQQAPVMVLLEEIFKLVLQFAADANTTAAQAAGLEAVLNDGTPPSISASASSQASKGLDLPLLCSTFRKKARAFVATCRDLADQNGHGYASPEMNATIGSSLGEGPPVPADLNLEDGKGSIEQLVLRLDMNGWYSTGTRTTTVA